MSNIKKFMTYSAFSIMFLPLTQVYGRSIYLNGQDVSAARGQHLEKVNLRIDDHGNVYIEAPHYQVNEEKSYQPLRSKTEVPNAHPEHRPPGAIAHQAANSMIPKAEGPAPSNDSAIEKPATNLQDKPSSGAPN